MPATADLHVDQGAKYQVTFTYRQPSDPSTPTVPGPPVDVTGWDALLQLRDLPGSEVLLSLDQDSGITVGTTDGTFIVAMTAEQTSAFTFRRCQYDLLVTPPSSDPIRLIQASTVFITPAISVPS